MDIPSLSSELDTRVSGTSGQKESALETLKFALGKFGDKVSFASSFGAEDVVIIDLLSKTGLPFRIFTLDTGRLHEETYEVMEACRQKYNLNLETYFPDRSAVEKLEQAKGFYSFRESIEARKECCRIRKVDNLKRSLKELDAWITGLRAEQAVTRTAMQRVEDDTHFGLIKFNPLIDWNEQEVWDYIKANKVPYNALHDQNFPSIGCAPCTRAVKPCEDVRAGRWWWETPEQKECGLHKK